MDVALHLTARQWATVDAAMDNAARAAIDEYDDAGPAVNIREAGWAQIPRVGEASNWPPMNQLITIALRRDQWDLVVTALLGTEARLPAVIAGLEGEGRIDAAIEQRDTLDLVIDANLPRTSSPSPSSRSGESASACLTRNWSRMRTRSPAARSFSSTSADTRSCVESGLLYTVSLPSAPSVPCA
jgi:hypothetical protein